MPWSSIARGCHQQASRRNAHRFGDKALDAAQKGADQRRDRPLGLSFCDLICKKAAFLPLPQEVQRLLLSLLPGAGGRDAANRSDRRD